MRKLAALAFLSLVAGTVLYATSVQRVRYIAEGGETTVTMKLASPVKPGTIVAVFNLLATAGDHSHPGKLEGRFFSGTIDYASGQLELTFPSALKAKDRIEVRYEKAQ